TGVALKRTGGTLGSGDTVALAPTDVLAELRSSAAFFVQPMAGGSTQTSHSDGRWDPGSLRIRALLFPGCSTDRLCVAAESIDVEAGHLAQDLGGVTEETGARDPRGRTRGRAEVDHQRVDLHAYRGEALFRALHVEGARDDQDLLETSFARDLL